MRIERIPIKNLLPNPFRNMEHYKIPEAKIEALIRSFKTNGVWPNVIGRRIDHKVQQAFGHARAAAGRRLYGEDHKVDVIVMDLTDDEMLRMMADENGELWGADFLVDMETVQAALKHLRVPINGSHAAQNIANFLGWVTLKGAAQERVGVAIRALDLIGEGVLKIDQFDGLGTRSARTLVEETITAKRRIKADMAIRQEQIKETTGKKKDELQKKADEVAAIPAKVGEAVSSAMRTGKVGYREARKVTNEITDGKVYVPPPISTKFIDDLCRSIAAVLSPHKDKKRLEKINAVLDAKDILSKEQVKRVADVLVDVSDACLELADQLTRRSKPHMKALPA